MPLPETQKVIHGNEYVEPVIMEIPLPKLSQNQVIVKIGFALLNPTKRSLRNKQLIGA